MSGPSEPPPAGTAEAVRRAELAGALREVRERIDAACAAAGRRSSAVRLLAVTKTFPVTDVAYLTDLGLTDFAENRDQEAVGKVSTLAGLRPDLPVRWHMIGRMQRNKARSVAQWAAEVQSVDSVRLADALAKAVGAAVADGLRTGPLKVLIQISLDADRDRGGCPVAEVPRLTEHVTQSSDLSLGGLMMFPPLGVPPDDAFARLADIAEQVRADHPDATEVSAGMSGDLEAAIAHGSTCVRVGTALLGGRRLASPQEI